MHIVFDNTSLEITRPQIINEVRNFIKETMKKVCIIYTYGFKLLLYNS